MNLRDGNTNLREALKNQIKFKSDLGKMKKGSPESKTENQVSVIKNVQIFFDLREKIINFLEIIVFCYLRLNTKQNWKGSENINS